MCAGSSALLLGSRDAIREAFSTGLIYNPSTAEAIIANITGDDLPAFRDLRVRLQDIAANEI